MANPWINFIAAACALLSLQGCSSSLKKVTNENAPTMKQIYDQYSTSTPAKLELRRAELLQRPAVSATDSSSSLPPYPEDLEHLYPRLPNPDLFMYVTPHAVGQSGAPIPAYITRFSMYERQPYALPGETLSALKATAAFRVKSQQPTTNSKSEK